MEKKQSNFITGHLGEVIANSPFDRASYSRSGEFLDSQFTDGGSSETLHPPVFPVLQREMEKIFAAKLEKKIKNISKQTCFIAISDQILIQSLTYVN